MTVTLHADGMWGFGDEVVCCYTVGSYEAPSEHTSMHAVDKTKPFETRQSRSMDGGVTWEDSILMPAESGGRGISADEQKMVRDYSWQATQRSLSLIHI